MRPAARIAELVTIRRTRRSAPLPGRAMVCSIKRAMVVGPTPPGTGVIMPATVMASEKATSPTFPSL